MKSVKERKHPKVGLRDKKDNLIQDLRANMLRDKEQLNAQVSNGEIDPVTFARRVNSLMADFLREARRILSPREFEQTFGAPYSSETPIVVDPETAAFYSRK
jgi:hypothetical protein